MMSLIKTCAIGRELKCTECIYSNPYDCGKWVRHTLLKEVPQFTFRTYDKPIRPKIYYGVLTPAGRNSAYSHICTHAIRKQRYVRFISADTAIYEKMTMEIEFDTSIVWGIKIVKSYPEQIMEVIDSYANIFVDKMREPIWILGEPHRISNTYDWEEIE